VQGIKRFAVILLPAIISVGAVAQHAVPAGNAKSQAAAQAKRKLTPEQKFVIDTVRMAVALPQPDPQDRLRVLSTAADVVSPIDRKMARSFWQEGVRVESELIRIGQKPTLSMMASGQADCAAAQNFVENLPESALLQAEQSLIAATTSCSKQTLDIISRKLDAGLEKGIVPARALMAAMDAQGLKSPWSQLHFTKMFASLPDPAGNAAEAENFAAMYAHMSGSVDASAASKTGVQLLVWLGKLQDNPLRNLAVHITTGAMKETLGEEGFRQAMSSDVVANSVAQNAEGKNMNVDRPSEQGISVLEAMQNNGTDQSDKLRQLPAVERARESAAHGFAVGTAGNKEQAAKYFDMAFAAVDEAWDARSQEETKDAGPDQPNAASVVQEVGEAAAEVDSIQALQRAQKLRDTSAQAIAMLAVARVVASNGIAK